MRLYRSKYGAKKTEVDGIVFDSKKEAGRYQELILMGHAGEIGALLLQPRYKLYVNKKLICTYRGDFFYFDRKTQGEVVEEVKGFMTRDAAIKIKLFTALYPEVELRVIK